MPDMAGDIPAESRDGQVVTFYSYKGGTGRTMALANVAWILAANGRRVLVADWDLESPGLHRFFHPFLAEHEVRDAPGVIDLVRRYEWEAARASEPERQKIIPERARVQQYAMSLSWEFPDGGSLDFLSAGRQNADYAATLGALDWDGFYEALGGGEFFDAVRADMKRHYDYALIDSRSGLSDVADICVVHMPDVLVDCFTLSTQGLEGAADVARQISQRHPDRGIRILPVPMRVDPAEKEKVEAGHALAVRLFEGLPAALSDAQRRDYWAAVEVPYQAYYSYEEVLAVFGDAPGSPATLLASFERLTAQITMGAVTALPPMDELLRARTRQLFARSVPPAPETIVLEFVPEDQLWAEWIAGVLRATGISVRERRLAEPSGPDDEIQEPGRRLAVVTAAYIAGHARPPRESPPDLVVYITAGRPFANFATAGSAVLAGVPEREAVERIYRLLGISGLPGESLGGSLVRYPGTEPKIGIMPARNPRFTGRDPDLRQLREQLRDYGSAVLLPLTLQGLGGVGKTQLALEYAHRFRADYDLMWWVDCGQPQFIDASLADLAARIHDVFAVGAPVPGSSAEATRQALELLSSGEPTQRWLLVYDSADDIEAVRPYLPSGGGQVLITSRNRAWADQARPMPVEVFTRAESVTHLRLRVPSITAEEGDQVAEALGDLPLAVAAAGAWLAETGVSVPDYLSVLSQQAPRALSISQLADYPLPISQAWDLSLSRLRERSPAAARLFELCSVMAPSIASDLVFSAAMAGLLAQYDPALSEPMVIGRLVQEINRLALISLDTVAGQIHVHRLVQAVVHDQMSPEQLAVARQDVHQVLVGARPGGNVDDPGSWPRYQLIWPHLTPSRAETSTEEPVRQLCIDRVRYLWQHHDLDRGGAVAAELDAAWTALLAATPEPAVAEPLRKQLLHLRFHRAGILRDQGRFEEARALDEAVRAEQQELLGPGHPHTLMTAGGLAADLRAGGRYTEALAIDQLTYSAWVELYGEDYPGTLAAATSLAISCRLAGDLTAALRLDEEALRRRRITLGSPHPRTLDSGVAVARDLLGAGRYAEAAALTQEVRQLCADTLGTDSFAALNAQALLGIALRRSGQHAEAEGHFLAASDGLIRESGESSSEALACQLGHALNVLATGRAGDAEAAILQVLAAYEERRGPSHPDTLACRVNLANTLRATRQLAAGIAAVRSVAEDLRDALGSAHPYSLAARMALGVLQADQGDLAAADEVEAEAAQGLAAALGDDHPDTLRCSANLLLIRQQRGDVGARAQRVDVIDRLAALIGPDHPDIGALCQEDRLMPALDPEPC